MNFGSRHWKTSSPFLIVLLTGLLVSSALASSSSGSSAPSGCALPEYRGFDFWVGNWDVFDFDHPKVKVAQTHVESILGGCVLHEDYEDDQAQGQSFTIYDASRKVWHQTWVTNHGRLLTIEGTMQNGVVTLNGQDRNPDGKLELVRGVWRREGGEVRETGTTSLDGGKTWTPWFALIFRPAASPSLRAPASAADDATLSALDDEYQEAVKKNDYATMGRLLSDDFLLVTGTGKRWTKSDLLNEAQSGRILYTHQEDSERTIRIWEDSAIVTAKLWEQGTEAGKAFDSTVWFSDTYLRTPEGWRYVFGQSSVPVPH